MPRDRLTIDLCGIAQPLRAYAQARNAPVASVVRALLLTQLGVIGRPSELRPSCGDATMTSKRSVKVTVRLPTHIAERMTARARASGASYGTYLSSLIEDAPPMPALAHRREALVKLGASTDRLAAVFVDLKHLDRLLHDRCESATHLALDSLSTMVAELRSHLALASGVISELKPSANRSVPASNTGLSQQG